MNLANKYKAAIIFLCLLVVISLILLSVYWALKRGFCDCVGGAKDDEDELVTSVDENDKISYDFIMLEVDAEGNEITKLVECDEEIELQTVADVVVESESENEDETVLSTDVVTESVFVAPKKRKRLQIPKAIKRIRRPCTRVRFDDTVSPDCPLIGDSINTYGTYNHNGSEPSSLRPASSLESFMSADSLANTVKSFEEFGKEVSPSRVQVYMNYDLKKWLLTIGVKQAQCLIVDDKERKMYWQVHITLLPFKKHRYKTRYKSTSSPIFNQTFQVTNIARQALSQMAARYRVYARTGKMSRKKLAGEMEFKLEALNTAEDMTIQEWRIMRRKYFKY